MSGRRNKFGLAVVAGALLCLGAYVSASYILNPAVVDSGGGRAESSNYQVDASIGGPVIATTAGGTATSASYKLEVNSMGLIAGPAKAPSTGGGGGGGGCVGAGSGASAAALLLPLGMLVFLKRRRGTVWVQQVRWREYGECRTAMLATRRVQ